MKRTGSALSLLSTICDSNSGGSAKKFGVIKPFECVATVAEITAALALAAYGPNRIPHVLESSLIKTLKDSQGS